MKAGRSIVAVVAALFVSVGLQGLAFRGFAPVDPGPVSTLPYTGTIPLHDGFHLLAGILLLRGSRAGRRTARMGAAAFGGVVLAAMALPTVDVGPIALGPGHMALYSIAALALGIAAVAERDREDGIRLRS